ncbi:PRC-barrel domain-containing protein [Alkalimonas sp.]|uniref:PRC-barrel domain-containing protein n=1 Tax=Alkalimonas sp. TaxID=1872453 RepID=UPI00263B3C8B|nr:PRC-barrel domain-containing protein [Alkalimonas sp.]MCC5825953.1 PRC-barrel domain-containing protein [Alkalimonas sp.]
MKKLHSLVFYALVTPALTLGAASVLAQSSAEQDSRALQQSTQLNQQSSNKTGNYDKSSSAERKTELGQRKPHDQARMQNRGHIDAVPAKGAHASNLIGANVRTNDNEDIGSVDDLILDEQGQIVAIIVSVGGFLGMGQKDVAIGWDNITRSGTADKLELRVDVTRDDLRSAPKFVKREQSSAASNTQREQSAQQRAAQNMQQGAQPSDMQTRTDQRSARDQSRQQNRGHIDSTPIRGSHANNLIGANVRTNDNEDIGSVGDLILNEQGQIVAIIVSVGGFLGMGQKDVAIGWDNVTRSGTGDKQELLVDVTREDLNSAPKFASRD